MYNSHVENMIFLCLLLIAITVAVTATYAIVQISNWALLAVTSSITIKAPF